MPSVTDFLDSLGSTNIRKIKYFTTLDCVQAYLQIKVYKDSRDYTAFVTHSGLYRHTRMPYGCATSGSEFMRIVNDLFREHLYKDVLVYLDDIICFSEDFDEHIKLFQSVFDILAKANLKLKPIKCKYALNKIKYLGNIISEEGLSPDPGKLQAIRDYPPPKSLKELKGFIGLCNYYRRHINNFSKYSKCLTDLTRKDVPFIWSEECERSFNTLKQKLMSAPTVALPRYDQDYTIFTDASGSSLAAVLTQVQDGQERLISCVGRNMLPAETRYSAHEKESLAIFYAFKMFDPYVRYSHTDVYTDCKSLCEILTKRPISPIE